ncbi:MAG: hypothetical protein KIS94_00460 [Chitinophagales bacterium]|nr:hypothetical protein [Chitinophagales bacterium]
MSHHSQNSITGKHVVILLLLTNAVYALMLLKTIPMVMSYAGNMKLPDMMPTGYNAAYINELMQQLGEEGRHIYLTRQLPVDMVYPFLFGACYAYLTAYFLLQLDKLNGWWRLFIFFPVAGGLFDYAENIGVVRMLNAYPNISNSLTAYTSLFTVLKSAFTTISFTVLIMFFAGWVGRKFWKK